ncbi:uncharacterized protein B0H18DRAFT_1114165 [Fomitopsis serialis]|uniref:uncharacterized protein n=1 Tax=Fomitopsis serialis TaxID=139415 RepID=UPI0020089B40|nr:uncharacterized protein B0H18DRAFT_1114165 [Neoantrodia serialis]KAH9935412.1 hypothetical protein B0H18DRAFT_1114165 [Neoantrodia serialis]
MLEEPLSHGNNDLSTQQILKKMSESTPNTSEPTRSSRGPQSGTRSKLKALRTEVRAKRAASQERINKALNESKQLEAELLAMVDATLSEASSRSQSSRTKTARTESSDHENSAGAPMEQAPSDHEVERAPCAEELEHKVEPAQSRQETPPPSAPAPPTKLGTTVKSGACATLDGAPVAEPEPEFSHENGTELASSRVARSEMSCDIKNIFHQSSNALDVSNDTAGDALNTRSVERHEPTSAVSAQRASTQSSTLDRHHLADDLPPGICLNRPNAHQDVRPVLTGRQARIRDWLAELPPVQPAVREDPSSGTRPPSPSLLGSHPSSGSPVLDLDPLRLDSGDPVSTTRGSGNMQSSRATQDLHHACASPAPSDRTAQNGRNEERGGCEENLKEQENAKEEEEEGCGASRESEQKGSETKGMPLLDVPRSPPPIPVPAPAGISTNEKLIVRPAGHEDRTSAFRDNSHVVPTTLYGNTADAQSGVSDVPILSLVPSPARISTNNKVIVCVTNRENGTLGLWDDLLVVPSISQGDTADALSCMSNVSQSCTIAHRIHRGSRSEGTSLRDVPTSPPPLPVPAPTRVPTNVELVVRAVCHKDGTSVFQGDSDVAPSPMHGDPAGVLHSMPKVFCPSSTEREVSGITTHDVFGVQASTIRTSPMSQSITIPLRAADTPSPSLDVCATAISASHDGVSGELHDSTRIPPSPPVSTPLRLQPRLIDGTSSIEIVAPASGESSGPRTTRDKLANKPSRVTTHDVSGVQTSMTGMSPTPYATPIHRVGSMSSSGLDVLSADKYCNALWGVPPA